MAKLSKEEISQAVYQQIEDSEGYDSDELAQLREDALDYYYNRPQAAPSAPGRSALQSSDIADMIEAVVAQVMPAFEIDCPVEFQPMGEDDVDQARAETDACNYVVMQQNNGFYELQQSLRDALLMRNGIMKVYLDEKVESDTMRMKGLTELEYGDLMRNAVEDLKNVDNGVRVELLNEENGFYDVRVTTKNTERKVCSRAIDPTNFSWERNYESIYLQDARFVAERSLPTRSDLIQMGYKKSLVNSLNAGGKDTQIDYQARNNNSETRNWRGTTPAEDIIEFYETYIRIDADGDGVTELLKVCVADKEILEIQEMQYIPYASGTPFLQPHRFNGLGLYDKLRYIQDAKTATLRQLIDNQNHANNARVGIVDGAANIDDVVNSRPGGVVRLTTPDAMVPFPFTDIGPSAQSTLDYMDKIRSERGGASLDLQSAELQLAGETAHGVERQMSAKEQLAAMMTRTLAETLIRSVYLLVHQALRLYVPEEMQFQVSDQFVTVNPADWQERKSVKVKAGLSIAERLRKKTALEAVIMRQDALQQQGKYVAEDDIYNAQLDWVRVQGMPDPERYFSDPASQEAQQFAMQQAAMQQQQQAYQESLLQLQRMIEERKADNDDAKVMEDARQFDQNLQYEYWKTNIENGQKEAELATDIAMQLVSNESTEETGAGSDGESTATGTDG